MLKTNKKNRESNKTIPETIKIGTQLSKESKREILEAMKNNKNNTTNVINSHPAEIE